MFKKTKIAAVSAAVLGLSSMAAQAAQVGSMGHGVSINTAGSEGEVLVFPYYNVNNDFITSFNITNTTSQYKAIKIRFRESENSNDVLDFNLYMSPNDVFTMNLNNGSDDGVLLTTTDKSCTDPAIPAGGVLFRHTAYATTNVADVREGYLEVIEMGVVNTNAYVLVDPLLGDVSGNRQVITTGGILHNASGAPADCSVVNRAWQQSVFVAGGARSNTRSIDMVNSSATGFPNYQSDEGWYGQNQPWSIPVVIDNYRDTDYNLRAIYPPEGGLVGSSILVNKVGIAGFVAEPISISNYSTRAQHYLSSDENFYLLPSLASGSVYIAAESQNEYSVVHRDWGMDDRNVLPRTSVPSGINPMPVADAILVTTLANQYFLGVGTRTDWVVSAPMRKHGIYNDYQYKATSDNYSEIAGDIPVAGDPANGYWKNLTLTANDVNASFIYWDREENQTSPEPGDFSPPQVTPETKVIFKNEVNILALGTGSGIGSVLGSDNAVDLTLDPGFVNGWGRFTFLGNSTYDLAGTRYAEWVYTDDYTPALGVPLFGFMAAQSDLGAASVGESFPHFYETNHYYYEN